MVRPSSARLDRPVVIENRRDKRVAILLVLENGVLHFRRESRHRRAVPTNTVAVTVVVAAADRVTAALRGVTEHGRGRHDAGVVVEHIRRPWHRRVVIRRKCAAEPDLAEVALQADEGFAVGDRARVGRSARQLRVAVPVDRVLDLEESRQTAAERFRAAQAEPHRRVIPPPRHKRGRGQNSADTVKSACVE